jgi:energy-converting hydrogenase Eha subunit G
MPREEKTPTPVMVSNPIPDWVMALIGISIVAWFLYTFNIMEILSLFFTLFVVPVVFIASLVMGGTGLYSAVSRNWNRAVFEIQSRVADKMENAA